MIGHHAVYVFVFHHLPGTENQISAFLLTCAANHLPYRYTNFGRFWTLQGRSCRVNRPWGANVWGVEIGTDWVEHVCQFLGAEMWCQLGLQILLIVSTIVLVVGKPAMVQLIRSASRSVWIFEFGAMFCSNNSGHGILELCKTILCETVGILARQGRQSCS
jgi:hypothetical protein